MTQVQMLMPKMPPIEQKKIKPAPPRRFWEEIISGKFAGYIKEAAPGEMVSNAEASYNVLKPMFFPQNDVEQFYGIFLNAKNRIIAIEKLFSGSISASAVYPREVIKRSLALKAAAVVFGHNHPSGDPGPSSEDYSITKLLFVALKSCGITLHDHIVVGEGFYSMAENGFFQKLIGDYNRFVY